MKVLLDSSVLLDVTTLDSRFRAIANTPPIEQGYTWKKSGKPFAATSAAW
jgi:hypothetical protein